MSDGATTPGLVLLEFVLWFVRLGVFIALWILIAPVIGRWLGKMVGGGWGEPLGQLGLFNPRRLWCRHRVAYRGPGTHGLWAHWCADCGKKVNR